MVRLLRYRSLTNISTDPNNLRRAFSEASLQSSSIDSNHTFLRINQAHITVGDKIVLSWNINEATSENDWIGLFNEDDPLSGTPLDTRTRGIGKNKQGSVIWNVPKDLHFKSAINYCCFRYFYGPTGKVVATSQTFSIDVPLSLLPKRMPSLGNIGADSLLVVSISGLSAKDLKKGFFGKPNPYLRMCIVPRFRGLAVIQKYHGQQAKTIPQNSTVNPSWKNEVFVFHATPADFLEVEIRNKSGTRFSKFLGKVSFPLCTIMDSCGYNKFRTVTQSLVGRNPSEKVQGKFQFTIFVRKSSLPKSEQESGELPQVKHKPIVATSSSPLDDMALPSGQLRDTGPSRRPVSYHPPSSHQNHCATEPRNRNHTANYFASAAFRAQGHPSDVSASGTQRQRTSNSLCHDHLSTLSSEEESESQDDDEDVEERLESASRNTNSSGQNGQVPDASAIDRLSEVSHGIVQAKTSTPKVSGAERTVTAEESVNSEPGATVAVAPLLRFTDTGPSLSEFLEQHRASSTQSSDSSANDVELDSSGNVSIEAQGGSPRESESSNVESATDQHSREGSNCEADSAVDSDGEAVVVSQEGDSSDTSADDGGDSAEHGYVEIEPGYVGDQSDTESQCSDVEEDEDDIYVGDDNPRESIAGSVLSGGDLLNECLDMLCAVGYTDFGGDEKEDGKAVTSVEIRLSDARKNIQAGSDVLLETRNEQLHDESRENEDSMIDVPQGSTVGGSLDIEAAEKQNSLQTVKEDAVDVSKTSGKGETGIGNVLSVLDDITMHAESLLNGSESLNASHSVTFDVGETAGESLLAAISQQTDRTNVSFEEGPRKPARVTHEINSDTGREKNPRNRSYYKAIFDVSLEDVNHNKPLSEQKSAPPALTSAIIYDKDGSNLLPVNEHNGGSNDLKDEVAVSQLEDMDAGPYSSHPRASAVTDSSVPAPGGNTEGFDTVPAAASHSTTSTETALFSSRHRILRKAESDLTSSVSPSTTSSANRHKISNRTDIDPNVDANRGFKLKYSVSDPVSKNNYATDKQFTRTRDVISEIPVMIREDKTSNPIFRSDLVESIVDEVSSISSANSGYARDSTSSNNMLFDAAKLEEVSVKSMRETAILSSSEDLASASSKNKPIGRTDQPVTFREITLPSAGLSIDVGEENKKEIVRRDLPLEKSEPTTRTDNASVNLIDSSSDKTHAVSSGSESMIPPAADRTPVDPEKKEKTKPPQLPPRNSSLGFGKQLEGHMECPTKAKPLQHESNKDPWENVTVRKERKVKAPEINSASCSSYETSVTNVVPKPEERVHREPERELPPATSSSQSSRTSTSITINSNISTVSNTASRDPSGDTRPRIPDRARAIVRTKPEGFPDNIGIATNHDKSRQRGAANGTNEHKPRYRSPSEPSVPLASNRARSPSELPVSKSVAVQPPIPPRSDRDRHTKGTAAKVPVAHENATSSSAVVRPQVVRKRTTTDVVSRERRDEQGPSSRGTQNNQRGQPPARSPAIIHSDAQGATGGNTGRPSNQTGHVDGNGEVLPSHWERAIDSHGRIYYIDHLHRTTTWKRPRKAQTTNEGESTTTAQLQQQHLQEYNRRYQSLRRTMKGQRRGGESNRPTILPQESRPAEPEQPRDRPRHLRRQSSENVAGRPKTESVQEASSTDGPVAKAQPSAVDRDGRVSFENTPGCRFIRRRDFFQYINNHGMASQFLHRSAALKQTVNRIRADPSKYERYQHSRDLVTLLNFFSNPASDIPPGWEKKSDQYGQVYFIDHSTRSTTFIDPRLPIDEPSSSGPRSRPPPSSSTATPEASKAKRPRQTGTPHQSTPGSATKNQGTTPTSRHPQATTPQPQAMTPQPQAMSPQPTSYNERVLAFLRQPGIEDVLKQKDSNLSSKNALRRKIMVIQRDGLRALDRLSNDMELVILLSVFEDEIQSFVSPDAQKDIEMQSPPEPKENKEQAFRESPHPRPPVTRKPAPYRRDFEAKLRTFHRQMVQSGYGQGPGKIRMKIRRDHVVSDAFEQLMKQSPRALQRDRLYIKFLGEEGLDYGGPAREFFFLISRQCFDPYYGLFEYSASDTYTLQISPVAARFVTNAHAWLRFCGRIIALSLVHQHLLDVFFTRTIYKALLRQSYDLSDIESFDPEFHQSLAWILENDITDALDMFFTTDEKVFDQITERELKPGGKSIPVSEDNKREYVDLMVKWRMERGVGEQMKQLVNGFNEVLDLQMISIFDARELELVIAGTADIDVKDWRTNTDYRSGYHDKHPVVQWFWKAVDSVNNEQRLRLLQFVTGTSSIPFEGFSALRGSTGPRKFTIDCWGDPTMLPRAHTCFNRLDLPPYRNFEELYEKLLYAVEETSSFGIE